MQRWQLTFSLAGVTALAAFVVPSLSATLQAPTPGNPDPVMAPRPDGPGDTTTTDAGFDGALEVSAALDQGALLWNSGQDRYVVIEVKAPELPGDVRRPVDLAVVMDTSGSMAARGKIDNARMAARELIGQLQPTDSFSLVTFSDSGRVAIASSSGADKARMTRLVDSIHPGGGTNLDSGLQLGLAQLQGPDKEGVRRVVVLSDGKANIGVTDTETLARTAGSLVDQGITVSAMGLGLDYNEDLLTAMSDAGGGQYHFVDQPGQLAVMFDQELQQMTRVAGREVAVDVALPPGVYLQEVYGWQASTHLDGYRVFLGDVHGGETRKIVARVTVDDSQTGMRDLADVHLRYTDADSGRAADEAVALVAEVTRDAALANASVNKPAGVAAARAHVGKLLDESARDYGRGDVEANQERLEEAQGLLASMRRQYDAPELDAEAEDIAEQAAAFSAAPPTSDEGLYQVKKAKEAARAYAR